MSFLSRIGSGILDIGEEFRNISRRFNPVEVGARTVMSKAEEVSDKVLKTLDIGAGVTRLGIAEVVEKGARLSGRVQGNEGLENIQITEPGDFISALRGEGPTFGQLADRAGVGEGPSINIPGIGEGGSSVKVSARDAALFPFELTADPLVVASLGSKIVPSAIRWIDKLAGSALLVKGGANLKEGNLAAGIFQTAIGGLGLSSGRPKVAALDEALIRKSDDILSKFETKDAAGSIPKNLLEEAKKFKTADEFVASSGIPLFHGSNKKIETFSNKEGSQGVIWFTDNPKAISSGESGAQGVKHINESITTGEKFAGWDEYEKLGLGQIEEMGFDGIKLPTTLQDGTKYNDYILFDNKTLKTKAQLKEIFDQSGDAPADFDPAAIIGSQGKIQSKVDQLRLVVQDQDLAVQRLQEFVDPAGRITEAADIRLGMELYPGRTQARLDDFIDLEVAPIVKEISDNKVSRSDLQEYLLARHAPERNATLGDGAAGMTTREAEGILARFEREGSLKQLETLGSQVTTLARRNLDGMLEDGLISKGQYDSIVNRGWDNYVPLQRVFDDQGDIVKGFGSSKGFVTAGKEFHKAKGSKRSVEDILENIILNQERAIVRAEKNKVGNAVLEFMDEFGDTGVFRLNKDAIPERSFKTKVKGEEVKIEVADDDVLKALKGLGVEEQGLLVRSVGTVTRYMSAINTSLNPEFILTNLTRDLQQAAIVSSGEVGLKASGKIFTKAPQSIVAVFDGLKRKKTEGAAMFDRMRKAGGTTGFFQVGNRDVIQKNLKGLEDSFATAAVQGMAGASTKVLKKTLKNVKEGINTVNDIVENSTRYTVFKQAVESGMSDAKAAKMAKNATVNFNKKGRWGSVINSFKAFFNASVQGAMRTAQVMKNPKTAATALTTIGGFATALNAWNNEKFPEEYARIPNYVKDTNFVLGYGVDEAGELQYIKVPLPWGFNVIKVLSDATYDKAMGNEGWDEGIKRSVNAIANAYNPLGGDDLVTALTPTALTPAVDLLKNKNFFGSKIFPDYNPNIKDSLQYWDSTSKVFVNAAKLMSEAGGGEGPSPAKIEALEISPETLEHYYDAFTGGVGKFVKNVITTAQTGKDTPARSIPFARRFLGETDSKNYNRSIRKDLIGDSETTALSHEQRNMFLSSIKDDLIDRRISDKEAKKQINKFDRNQKKLGEVFEVAKFIKDNDVDQAGIDKILIVLEKKGLTNTQLDQIRSFNFEKITLEDLFS